MVSAGVRSDGLLSDLGGTLGVSSVGRSVTTHWRWWDIPVVSFARGSAGSPWPGSDVWTHREWFLIPCIRATWMEEDGAAALVLIHQIRVLEMTNQSWFPLDSGISKWRYLLTVKFLPLLAIETLIQWDDVLRIGHIYESIANITFVLEVNWQVNKIVSSLVIFINSS